MYAIVEWSFESQFGENFKNWVHILLIKPFVRNVLSIQRKPVLRHIFKDRDYFYIKKQF